MKYRRLVLLGALVVMASMPIAGQTPKMTDASGAPIKAATQFKTPWGDPDLQGLWRFTSTNFERPAELAGKEVYSQQELDAQLKRREANQEERLSGRATNRAFRAQENYNSVFSQNDEKVRVNARTASIVDPPDGLLPPWTLDAVKRWEAREVASKGRGEGWTVHDINTGARCIQDISAAKTGAWGLGFGPSKKTINDSDALGREDRYDAGEHLIVQSPGWVGILDEEAGSFYWVPTDGRPAPSSTVRAWGGIPRGHWDNGALVVEVTNVEFDYPLIPNGGFQAYPGDGKRLKVTMRFTRTGAGTMDYRFTVEDPDQYVRPYTVVHDLWKDDGSYKISPPMCQENNNKNISNVLANGRADEIGAIENHAASVRIRAPRLAEIKRAEEAAEQGATQSAGVK